MAKILKIENDIILVGNDDGSLTEIRLHDCNFNPNVGDEVDIFSSENKTLCVKKEKKQSEVKSDMQDLIKNGGININVSQGSHNTGVSDFYSGFSFSGNDKHVVDKATYIILAFFVGGFGIHKFYAGKIGMGVIYVLFCWTFIPAIIAFFEAIVAAFQKSDAQGRIVV